MRKNIEKITQSTPFNKIRICTKIAYGIIAVAGIVYVLAADMKGCIEADQSQACQEIESCIPSFDEACYRRITTKENADHCVINDQGVEECCRCSCYYNNI
jgi:hypothetical protein